MIEQYRNKILQGDSLAVLKTLPDSSIDMCVTSPPYWGLRAYGTNPQIWDGNPECEHEWNDGTIVKQNLQAGNPEFKRAWREQASGQSMCNTCTKCGAWKGELGLEPTFQLYIEHLCQIFDEVKRVLKPEGTCWVNLGDSYASSGGASRHIGYTDPKYTKGRNGSFNEPSSYPQTGAFPKSLCQIPSRFAIAMTDNGWILRNTIIWYKGNCMPSSANDRFTVDYEMFYFFTKQPKYYFEQQFEQHSPASLKDFEARARRGKLKWGDGKTGKYWGKKEYDGDKSDRTRDEFMNPQGRNKRCVWQINTKPLKEAHFASFPEKLVETPIKASCPEYICSKCGKAREKIYEVVGKVQRRWSKNNADGSPYNNQDSMINIRQNTAYTDCGCGAEFVPGIVLDPFMGSGTTAVVAKKLHRSWIGIELNPEYIEIANKRINNTVAQTEFKF